MPLLLSVATLVTCAAPGGQGQLHSVSDAALAWEKGRILWVGPEADVPQAYRSLETVDARDQLVLPGLIDCHTHLAFGGWRADEFERRIQGTSYLDVAREGGGIARTVRQTRARSEEQLFEAARGHLRAMTRLGVTTVECKSGYGLDLEHELKLLRVYRRLNASEPNRVVSTFLGAHVVPPEYAHDPDAYVQLLVEQMIPAVAEQKLASFCDAFVERSAFNLERARAVLTAGARHGLRPKLHVDQLINGSGAALAAELNAISADHLEHVSPAGVAALGRAGVVAVSLPIATLYLNQPPLPARALIQTGVPVAVATDFNPGSAPSYHLPWAMSLACVSQRMTPAEVVKGATLYAAQAVGMEDEVGSLIPGKRADFVLVDAPDVNHWLYHFRPNAVTRVFVDGVEVRGEAS